MDCKNNSGPLVVVLTNAEDGTKYFWNEVKIFEIKQMQG